jgi:hypothetical protein
MAMWWSRAFGLTVGSDLPIWGLSEGPEARPSERRARIQIVLKHEIDETWRADEAIRIGEGRGAEGAGSSTVDWHREVGYRLYIPGYGLALISPDGARILGSTPGEAGWRFDRFLVGRVLPFAALLQGVEVFHASGVTIEGQAVALLAPSGGGKTSLAINLVLRGASFITDDVLAVEPYAEGLRALPGPPLVSLRTGEEDLMSDVDRERLGRLLDRADKAYFSVEGGDQALPLGLAYCLRRGGTEIAFIEDEAPDPLLLLASSFVLEVRTPERMRKQLDVCARLARGTRLFTAAMPAGASAATCAEALEAHAVATLGRPRSPA